MSRRASLLSKVGMLCILCIAVGALVNAARPAATDAAHIRAELERLRTLGSVLMIAAHPDDENTAMLAYFAQGRHMRTAYLSMTRGEGGQNLIGSEQSELMGVIRTQELLSARRIDGAEQFFTRAIDFGFSKTAEETLRMWGHDAALSDVVWVIRKYRPDVVVMRFSGTPRDGHGNHQASGILGREAYKAAADPNRFPEQLKYVKPWQATRLMYNGPGGGPGGRGGGPGGRGGRDGAAGRGGAGARGAQARQGRGGQAGPQAPPANSVMVDVGEYNPMLGLSYGEIAGMSRSQHKSQGMGSAEREGSQENLLITEQGEPAKKDVFDGIDTSWNRLPGGAAVGALIDQACTKFDIEDPSKVVPLLLQARELMAKMDDPWAQRKREDATELIAAAAGLSLEADAAAATVSPGGDVRVAVHAINRSKLDASLEGVTLEGLTLVKGAGDTAALAYNKELTRNLDAKVPANQEYTQPYWLRKASTGTMYQVDDPKLLGEPEAEPWAQAHFRMRIAGSEVEFVRPVRYQYVDRVRGELTRPVEVAPPVSVELAEQVTLFPAAASRRVEVRLRATLAKQDGEVALEVPKGFQVQPAKTAFHLAEQGETSTVSFEVTPPAGADVGWVKAVATVGGRQIHQGLRVIDYEHIPPQTVFPESAAKLVRTDVKMLAKRIGYVMGAGDQVPQALRQMGATVTMLETDDLARGDLSQFDAIVTGVRAYNVREDLATYQSRLLDYVKRGGTLVVQYNTAGRGPALEKLGPYPFQEANLRVTVEEAALEPVKPDIPLLQAPNHIVASDYDGWVQERGLYFADKWDPQYQPVWKVKDPGEEPQEGATLYTHYGEGMYIFSPMAWFRQLPGGVPGAYRLFANLVSAGKVGR